MPRSGALDSEHWGRRLAVLAERHAVPGAALGIGCGDEVAEAAYGVLSTDTAVEATTDSVFQIGSITKVWTATLVMQLVDEGELDLDAPVADVLPELALADSAVAAQVTMRHLLSHTSGIDGDIFADTGRGDDCLERYVAGLRDAAQNHPLGVTVSYCNSGFVLAGRIVEKLTGTTWDTALQERIIEPLGLTHTVTLPEDALRFRTAIGHIGEPDEAPHPVAEWGLMRSVGPAGLICATAADVLTFVRMHLSGGRTADGVPVLSEAGVAAMQRRQADVPDPYPPGAGRGLGWSLSGWDGHRLIGHDGVTRAQSAFLRVLPAQRLAVTLLTNGGRARDLYQDLFREVLRELAGVDLPRPIEPRVLPPAVDLSPYVGCYERAGVRMECFVRDGGLVLRETATGPLAALAEEPTEEHDLSCGSLFEGEVGDGVDNFGAPLLAVDVDLADHHPGAVIDRGQQMPGVGSVAGRASHRLAVDGQRPPQRAADSRLTRRAPTCRSAARTCSEALAAHSPIAAKERQPASTAHTASPKIIVMPVRHQPRCVAHHHRRSS